MSEIEMPQLSTSIDMTGHCDVEGLMRKLVEAGERNQMLSQTDGFDLNLLNHEAPLDHELNLNLLHLAAWTGDMVTIEHLERIANVDVKESTAGGFSSLHLAASRGHTDVLQTLLTWPDVDVCALSTEGFTALHLAAAGGHHQCVKALLQKCSTSAHVSARDKVLGRTALHWAVGLKSSRKVFDLLIENQVDVCAKDRAGFTALHFATMNVTQTEFTSDKKESILSKLGDQNFLQDENTEQWIKDFFLYDEEKLRLLQRFQNSEEYSDRSLEQMIISQPVLEDLPQRMVVNEILNTYPDQVSAKVGDVHRFLSRPEVKNFEEQKPWRKLSGIRTIHPGSNGVEIHESMSGYSVLHLAACQDNPDLISYLLRFPDIRVNEGDMIYGMTPLHCSLWSGAMEAFYRLMAFEGVDVNARLLCDGKGPRESVVRRRGYSRLTTAEVTLRRGYSRLTTAEVTALRLEDSAVQESQSYLTVFQSGETPLHFGIRYCLPEHFLRMMTTFGEHPELNPAICNSVGLRPLQLGWARSVFTLYMIDKKAFPEKFHVGKEVNNLRAKIITLNRYRDSAALAPWAVAMGLPGKNALLMRTKKIFSDLHSALALLEEHPKNAMLVRTMMDAERRSQNVTNCALVAAVLIAGSTFQAALQPPEYPDSFKGKVLDTATFWLFNCLGFTIAMYILIRCFESFSARPVEHYRRLYLDDHIYFSQESRITINHLIYVVLAGVVTYVGVSYINYWHDLTHHWEIVNFSLGIFVYCFLYMARKPLLNSYQCSPSIPREVIKKYR